jgi:hypothetical protein
MKFKNGNELKILSYDPACTNVRGERSNLFSCNCFDIETSEWCVMELDRRKPIDRYIPEWLYAEWHMTNNKK